MTKAASLEGKYDLNSGRPHTEDGELVFGGSLRLSEGFFYDGDDEYVVRVWEDELAGVNVTMVSEKGEVIRDSIDTQPSIHTYEPDPDSHFEFPEENVERSLTWTSKKPAIPTTDEELESYCRAALSDRRKNTWTDLNP